MATCSLVVFRGGGGRAYADGLSDDKHPSLRGTNNRERTGGEGKALLVWLKALTAIASTGCRGSFGKASGQNYGTRRSGLCSFGQSRRPKNIAVCELVR